ncbi:MAG: carboxypeptidase regulatory-like domain-containing protein [Ignavibacteriales bacterium]|nr:carboxypeptidase regulatory-like domain-containing protein [Ignavibacteriales bacterium]
MRDLKYLLLIFVTFHSIIFIGCSDNGNNPIVKNSGINGHVLYLDGSVGKFAQIQLRKLSSSLLLYTGADENGFYQFDSLQAGNYKVSFLSNNEDIYTYEVELSVSEDETYEQNIYILYKKIDEFNALKKSTDVFLIKFEPEGGKIGDNYQFVDYLSGTFIGDDANNFTLSSDIYFAPENLSWSGADSLFAPDNIRQNYEFVTSITETSNNGNHEIRFSGEDISKILSNPINGFIFVKNENEDKELVIPCVDFINNDFGLIIRYK